MRDETKAEKQADGTVQGEGQKKKKRKKNKKNKKKNQEGAVNECGNDKNGSDDNG